MHTKNLNSILLNLHEHCKCKHKSNSSDFCHMLSHVENQCTWYFTKKKKHLLMITIKVKKMSLKKILKNACCKRLSKVNIIIYPRVMVYSIYYIPVNFPSRFF